jgi:hypothetical protein
MPVDMPQPVAVHPAISSRFRVGELIPLKGLWFRIADLQGLGMALIAQNETGKSGKRGHGKGRRHPAAR